MTSCTHCGHPARWRADGEPVCVSHATDAALRGRRVELLPVPDVVDRLLVVLTNDDLCREAADEIRRLRARVAALEAGQSAGDRPLDGGGRLDGGSVTQTHGG